MELLTLVLPHRDNDGQDVSDAHAYLQETLLRLFGGWSGVDIRGQWRADSGETFTDESTRYEVYGQDLPETRAAFWTLAREVGRRAGQHSVLVTYGDTVQFIDTDLEERP